MNRRGFLTRAGQLAIAAGAEYCLDAADPQQAGALAPSEVAALQQSLEGSVLMPGSAGFEAARHDFNRRIDVAPSVIARCASPADAAACIRWATARGVRISLRSGGHSYEGFSLGPGIVIDLGSVNKIEVDAGTQTAVIGAGARLGPIYDALSPPGFTLPAGACPSVGIAGLTLGGGFGLLARKWGLTADNLLSLELVDASGRTLTASPDQHPDLFWASRGAGGGHFGVVTSLKFRVYPIPDVAIYEAHWPINQAAMVLDAWQNWAPYAPDDLTCELSIGAGVPTCKSVGQFLGSEDQLKKLLAPLTGVGSPMLKVWHSSFMDGVHYFAGSDSATPVYLKAKSDYALEKLSTKGIRTLLSHLGTLSGAAAGWVQFDNYGGAVNRAPQDATAFVHRAGTLYSVQYNAIWTQPAQTAASMQWIRDLYAAMRPYFSGYCYVNYCDLDLSNWQHAYYGANYKRLTQVKARYDPGNIFRFAQSIPPAR